MKSKELPMPVVYGVLGIIAVIVLAVAYMNFVKAPPQIDAKTLSPTRLEDPDPGRGPNKRDIYGKQGD